MAAHLTGDGLVMPASQSASGNANTLDDYEEGTWTPTFTGSQSNPTQSYARQVGKYVKIANTVTLTGYIELASSGVSAGSGNAKIGGFPFTTVTLSYWNSAGIIAYNAGFGSSDNPTALYAASGGESTAFFTRPLATGTAQVGAGNYDTGCAIIFTITYPVS